MNFACRLYTKRFMQYWPSNPKCNKMQIRSVSNMEGHFNATYISFFISKYSWKFHTTKADSFNRWCQCAFKLYTVKSIGAHRSKLNYFEENSIFCGWILFSKINLKLLVLFQLIFHKFLSNRMIKNGTNKFAIKRFKARFDFKSADFRQWS